MQEFYSILNSYFFNLVINGLPSIQYRNLLNLVSVDYLKVVNGVKCFLSKDQDDKEDQKNITEEIGA